MKKHERKSMRLLQVYDGFLEIWYYTKSYTHICLRNCWRGNLSIFAASMKSFSVSPPKTSIICVISALLVGIYKTKRNSCMLCHLLGRTKIIIRLILILSLVSLKVKCMFKCYIFLCQVMSFLLGLFPFFKRENLRIEVKLSYLYGFGSHYKLMKYKIVKTRSNSYHKHVCIARLLCWENQRDEDLDDGLHLDNIRVGQRHI